MLDVIRFLWLHTEKLEVTSLQFQLTSELTATTPTFTLTCTSTGGPATTVSWTVNNHTVTEDSAYNITSQILIDPETATYNHTLAVNGTLSITRINCELINCVLYRNCVKIED